MLIGGIVSRYSLRLTIALSFVPYFIGGIIALFIKDYGKKAEKKSQNLLKDILANTKEVLKNKNTRAYILAYIVGKELTHPHIWIFTPLLIMVGVPIEIVSIGWILTEIFKIIGAKIGEKLTRIKTSTKFILSIGITALWMSVLIINTNIFTIWVFLLNGLILGLISASLSIPLQESVKEEYQTSVISIASTGARLFYVPLVYIINYLGNIKLQLALIGMIVIFVPIGVIVFKQVRKYEDV